MGFRVAILSMTMLVPACGDGSGTFALPDGCYYSAESRIPVLKIQGSRAQILIPGSDVREAQVRPRVNREGAYLEASPGFYLKPADMRAVASGQGTARFAIEARDRGSQVIMVPVEGASEEELRLGALCPG